MLVHYVKPNDAIAVARLHRSALGNRGAARAVVATGADARPDRGAVEHRLRQVRSPVVARQRAARNAGRMAVRRDRSFRGHTGLAGGAAGVSRDGNRDRAGSSTGVLPARRSGNGMGLLAVGRRGAGRRTDGTVGAGPVPAVSGGRCRHRAAGTADRAGFSAVAIGGGKRRNLGLVDAAGSRTRTAVVGRHATARPAAAVRGRPTLASGAAAMPGRNERPGVALGVGKATERPPRNSA